MKPTPEQEDCIAKFATGRALRINAYAGTGKSTTLKLIGTSTQRHGVCVMFNKSVADDARKTFPENISCSTMHSLAFRAIVKEFDAPKMTGNVNGGIVSMKMNIKPRTVLSGSAIVMQLSPRNVGFLMSETVKRWMNSDRDEVNSDDVPLDGKLGKLDPSMRKPIVDDIVEKSRKLWQRMISPSDSMPLGHSGYLKLYALKKPILDADFIMLDEAQDTNPVVLGIMRNQPAQLCFVGDAWQSIYQWRGAVNAMRDLPADLEARLSTSFRFGEGIADYASGILALMGETVPLKGNPAKESRVGPNDQPRTILCRTNARLIETVFDLVAKGKRPHIIGGVDEAMAWIKGAESLMAGRPVERPMELFGFQDWDDVRMVAEIDQDPDLQRWVRFIDQHGTSKLKSTLERLPKIEAGADVVLCTGHKSKGREWPSVELIGDFLLGIKTRDTDADKLAIIPDDSMEPELCLFYVACTRGMQALSVHPELQDKMQKLTRGLQQKLAAKSAMGRAA